MKTYIPDGSPLGAEARNMPLLVNKSTSTVGIPRLSNICLAFIFVITDGTAFRMWLDCNKHIRKIENNLLEKI